MNIENDHIEADFSEKTSGGFVTSDGYFDDLRKNILRKTVDNGFSTPENYFETLETRINQKINTPKTSQLKIIRFKKTFIGIAASLLVISGLFLIQTMFNNTSRHSSAEAAINELSDEEIIRYIDISDIKDSHLAIILPNTEDKTQKQVEDYLINNADEQLITDEL